MQKIRFGKEPKKKVRAVKPNSRWKKPAGVQEADLVPCRTRRSYIHWRVCWIAQTHQRLLRQRGEMRPWARGCHHFCKSGIQARARQAIIPILPVEPFIVVLPNRPIFSNAAKVWQNIRSLDRGARILAYRADSGNVFVLFRWQEIGLTVFGGLHEIHLFDGRIKSSVTNMIYEASAVQGWQRCPVIQRLPFRLAFPSYLESTARAA